MDSDQTLIKPCPACGGSDYTWGELMSPGMRFVPEDASTFKKLVGVGTSLPARRCGDCGNLQLFEKPGSDRGG